MIPPAFWIRFTAFVLATSALVSAHAADYILTSQTTHVVPTTRGAPNTTWFGWDSFGAISDPIDNTTPDIGTTTTGVRFRTVSGGDHTSGTGNYYSYGDTPDEEVTVVTSGTPGPSGKTTIIAQLVTLFGGFPAPWVVGAINGVDPVVVLQGTNAAGRGQLWAVWELPGNAETYTFKLEGVPGASAYSFDKIEIDTYFDPAGGSHPDNMVLAPPANFTLNKESSHVAPTTRGSLRTTHFGWDVFEDPATYSSTVLADETPDLVSATTPEGVKFESLHANLNRASSGNYYSGSSSANAVINEKVTVATNGTPGVDGKTTIIAQLVGTGMFPSTWTFGEINGVTPEVVAGGNAAGRGQVWVKWEIEGNAPTYEFTLSSVSHPSFGQAHMSFDKIEIDTWYAPDGASHPDSMILFEPPAIAFIMDQATGPVAPSSRSTRGTTYFGWDNFGEAGSVVDDNTPDIGEDSTGEARFRTTSGLIHSRPGGNIYTFNNPLEEEITVPTNGEVGANGFTTIILQLHSAQQGGPSAFSGQVQLGAIEGQSPVIVQGISQWSGMLWAKWVIPGNKPTYTITLSGPMHFSVDKAIVDTKYSRYEGVGDMMKAQTVEITTESLAEAFKGQAYSVQLEADGGAEPRVWSLKAGSTLPDGLSLSAAGLISGTPTTLGETTFTVEVEEGGGYSDEKTFALAVLSSLRIVTAETLPTAVVGRLYQVALLAEEGVAPYTWAKTGDLPAGVLLSEAGVISGTPSVVGDVSVTISVTDDEGDSVEKTFLLPVSGSLLAPVMDPLVLPATVVGAEFSHTLTAQNYPSGFAVNGLPKGLKLNPATGVISGRLPLAGVYPVQARAFNTAGSSPWVSGLLVVKALAVSQQGSFTGWSERDGVNSQLGSLITLRTTAAGAFTASVRTGKATRSARGFLNAAAPQVQAEVAGATLTLSIDPVSGELSGTHGSAVVTGWRAVWDKTLNPASGREGYYSVAIDLDAAHAGEDNTVVPKGVGFATFSVPVNGQLRVTGKTADGQNIVSSGPLGPNGEIAIYAPQYANKGSVLGQWELSEDVDGVFSENEISGTVTWQKPVTKGRAHAAAFGPLSLNVTGRYLAQSPKKQTVLGLPELGEFDIEFSEGGIGESNTVADVTGITWTEKFTAVMPVTGNEAGVKLKINKSTGAVSGTFTLRETTPVVLVRKNVKFFGQVVRTGDEETRAVGYFLLPQIPATGEKPNQTPILSGAVYLLQPAVP